VRGIPRTDPFVSTLRHSDRDLFGKPVPASSVEPNSTALSSLANTTTNGAPRSVNSSAAQPYRMGCKTSRSSPVTYHLLLGGRTRNGTEWMTDQQPGMLGTVDVLEIEVFFLVQFVFPRSNIYKWTDAGTAHVTAGFEEAPTHSPIEEQREYSRDWSQETRTCITDTTYREIQTDWRPLRRKPWQFCEYRACTVLDKRTFSWKE
jgi:hypothetical protein